ncbi:autotransporter domain-containing protein [Campylobacter sp. MOP51]|uniref:autotransporter domain-containing protein n=1 Tax=Campylobacter canis TaxID=3378588 RepID=UPI003C5E68C8
MKISKVVCGVLAGVALSSTSFAADYDLKDIPQMQAVNLDDDIAKSEKEKDEAKKEQGENNKLLEGLKNQKNQKEQEKANAEKELKDKRDKIESLTENIKEEDKKIKSATNEKMLIERLITSTPEIIKQLEKEIQTIDENIKELERQKESADQSSKESIQKQIDDKQEERSRKADQKRDAEVDLRSFPKRLEGAKEDLKRAEDNKRQFETQLNQAQQELNQLEPEKQQIIQDTEQEIQRLDGEIDTLNEKIKKQQEKIDKIEKELRDAKKQKLFSGNELSAEQKDVLRALLEFKGNDVVNAIISQGTAEEISEFVRSNATSINQTLDSLNKGLQADIIKFSSDLSTNTRLAKLSNPFKGDLALAYAVKNLKGEMFADSGDSMASVVRYYTDRFNYDSNFWGNIIGAKGKVKDGGNPELYGFTLGYDKAFDDAIFGAFVTYAKSKVDFSMIESEADNYQIGVYSRAYINNHEIDGKISMGIAKNELDRSVKAGLNTLNQKGKYNSYLASFDLDYGYVTKLSDTMFIKPTVGFGYSFVKNKAFNESGDLPLSYNANRSKVLNLRASGEFRKYVNDGSYLYIAPGVEREIYKSIDDNIVRFVGSNKDIIFKNNDKKSTYFTLQTGADFKITESLSTNLNFGVKAKSKNQFYNGSIGLKYKF